MSESLESWNPNDVPGTLNKYYQKTITSVKDQIVWYQQHRRPYRRLSWAIRFFIVLLCAIGGLCPLLGERGFCTKCIINFSEWGYIVIGIGVGLYGFDRFLGISSCWIRYTRTEYALWPLLHAFELEWAQLHAAKTESENLSEFSIKCLKAIGNFIQQVDLVVGEETKAWADEFQRNMASLESAMQLAKPKETN